MVCRRLLVMTFAAAALLLVVAAGSAAADHDGPTDTAAAVAVTSDAPGAAVPPSDAADPVATAGRASPTTGLADHGDERPCVMRADCAGALALGGLGLVLFLPPLAASAGGDAVPATRVISRVRTLRPILQAARLERPPQALLSW